MNVGIIGLGLIGGSMAKAIKNNTDHKIFGFDKDKATMDKAFLISCIDKELTRENLSECDFVIISLYPKDTQMFVKDNIDNFKKGAIVFDCAGVKENLCDNLYPITKESDIAFFGGHPMAGREFSGFSHSTNSLFKGASMIITPDGSYDINKLAELKNFILSLGFGFVVITSPKEHDKTIAYTSQLAHIVSSAYIKSPSSRNHKGFSAGSFKDLSRVAKLNEDMWTELFFENKENLISEIDTIVKNLKDFKSALESDNTEDMKKLLKEGRIIKESL